MYKNVYLYTRARFLCNTPPKFYLFCNVTCFLLQWKIIDLYTVAPLENLIQNPSKNFILYPALMYTYVYLYTCAYVWTHLNIRYILLFICTNFIYFTYLLIEYFFQFNITTFTWLPSDLETQNGYSSHLKTICNENFISQNITKIKKTNKNSPDKKTNT